MCMILSGGKNTFPDLARVAGGSAGVQRLIYKWGHCNHTHSFFLHSFLPDSLLLSPF